MLNHLYILACKYTYKQKKKNDKFNGIIKCIFE